MQVIPGINQIYAATFPHTLRNGVEVQLSSGCLQDVIDWSHWLQSERMKFMKLHIDLIPPEGRSRILLAAATGSITDAIGSLVTTIEGKEFLLKRSFVRANPGVDPKDFIEMLNQGGIDDYLNLCREISGRGGMIDPKSEEESQSWNRPIPPMDSSDME